MLKAGEIDEGLLKNLSRMFRVMGHPRRLAIMLLLAEAEQVNVNEIAKWANISQSNASQHLKSLEGVGLLRALRSGKEVYYHIDNSFIRDILALLKHQHNKLFLE
ncbi:MAG: ArsR family transcriptional regulator [Bacteroidetes bacterium]|nr:MAG: ArsR family transcriptional regulator [Bacteroidota bacterium]